jgi:virulence-associated protein VagC
VEIVRQEPLSPSTTTSLFHINMSQSVQLPSSMNFWRTNLELQAQPKKETIDPLCIQQRPWKHHYLLCTSTLDHRFITTPLTSPISTLNSPQASHSD